MSEEMHRLQQTNSGPSAHLVYYCVLLGFPFPIEINSDWSFLSLCACTECSVITERGNGLICFTF